MIDLMNTNVEPKEFKNQFDVLPKGTYQARVSSIGEWKPKQNATLDVFTFDSAGRKVQDENGKDVKTTERNVTTYSAQVIFEVFSGDYAGAKVYYYLNLHPNQPWALPAFLNACGLVDAIKPSQVQENCLDSIVQIVVDVETKPVPTTDKVTGLTTMVERERNVVKRVKSVDVAV